MNDEQALSRVAARIDDGQRKVLLAATTAEDLADGALLTREGAPLDSLLIVASGALALSIGEGAQILELGQLGPSAFFGELAVLEPTTASVTARAVGDTRVLRLSHASLERLRATDAKLASALLRSLIEELATRVRSCNTAVVESEGRLKVAADPERRSWLGRTFARLFGAKAEAA